MEIQVENHQKRIRINSNKIKTAVEKILRFEGVRKASLSFVFVSHQKIRALNKQFLKKNYATDVLAFDAAEENPSQDRRVLSGDIVISTDAAVKNAKLFSSTEQREVILYVIHGILHLLGYDDHHPKDTKKMRKKEEELLALVGPFK